MSADTDRFYGLLEEGINARRAAAGQSIITRVKVPDLEREAAERALEARAQVGLDGSALITHPSETQMLGRLEWPTSINVTELATWNYLWHDPTRAAVDTRTGGGSLFGLLNTEPHRSLLLDPVYTHWGTGIHREFRPGDDKTQPLYERWYFIVWLATGAPLPPGPYTEFGTSYGLPKTVSFLGKVTGRQFTQTGAVFSSKSRSWTTPSSATAGRRALIPGQTGVWLYIINGAYAGFWVPEGTVAASNA